MPVSNNKTYNQAIENCDNMNGGIQIHKEEKGFPPIVDGEQIISKRDELKASREDYELSENSTRIKYDAYNKKLKEVMDMHSGYVTSLQGFYTKKNQVLADFGIKPHKSPGKRGPKTPPPPTNPQ